MPTPQKIKLYYDPRGQVVRTVNPDNSEQRVVFGVPNNLNTLEDYTPTPWESYTYDANDNAGRTHSNVGAISTHWNTPSNSVIDALGRVIKTTQRLDNNIQDNEVTLQHEYDIQGNLLKVTDALNRIVFQHKYGLTQQLLWKEHIDPHWS